jgi:mono/diheme cytochrome c family protein
VVSSLRHGHSFPEAPAIEKIERRYIFPEAIQRTGIEQRRARKARFTKQRPTTIGLALRERATGETLRWHAQQIHSRILIMRCIKTERACRVAGLGLMFSALGCGGKATEDAKPAEPSYSPPRATPGSPPTAATPQRPQAAPVPRRNDPPSPPRPQREPVESESDLAKAAAENVLAANCGQCHGPALTLDQALDGINFINDIDALVRAGLIVPLSSATSRIIVVMRDGSMPPPASGLPLVTEADIGTVAAYIDDLRFWPDAPPPSIVDAGIDIPLLDAGPDAD